MTFHIPRGQWPLDFDLYKNFFERLGFEEREEGDFLVLPGGADLGVRVARDEHEKQKYHEYISSNRPVIGICRGFQLAMIESGACLIEHLPDNFNQIKHTTLTGDWRGSSAWHTTKLGLLTNTRHHQGFSEVPDGWKIIDSTIDSVVEAGVSSHCFGVQWHPEKEEMKKTGAEEWYVEFLRYYLRKL